MLVANTFAELAGIVLIAISGLFLLYIENHKPVYYVEEQEYMEVG